MTLAGLGRAAVVLTLVIAGITAGGAPAAAAAPGAASGASGGDVMAGHVNPDGSGWLVVYKPVSGISPERFYRQLKAAGVRDLIDPALRVSPADPQQCFHGTAFAMKDGICPPKTWTYQGHPRPIVYFRDYTGVSWPVQAAVQTWNTSVAIDSHWIASEVQCPSNTHCVPVMDGAHGKSGNWANACALTSVRWDSANHYVDGAIAVNFNDSYGTDVCGTHRSTACHELGHALGLSHNTSKTSCLYPNGPAADTPNSDDFWVLANMSY
ncbi:MAG TPA: matrixin family metalloprotease [Micromonosporaceae bacterium]|nr:matrixin family metalloprotease [Micromonosporaceae bacterium]